jgi:outer membrane protein TolC
LTDPGISAKAEQVQAEAAALPSLEEIRELAGRAVAHGGTPEMSLDEIRALADQAVDRAEQVTVLLRRLADLLGPGAGGEP